MKASRWVPTAPHLGRLQADDGLGRLEVEHVQEVRRRREFKVGPEVDRGRAAHVQRNWQPGEGCDARDAFIHLLTVGQRGSGGLEAGEQGTRGRAHETRRGPRLIPPRHTCRIVGARQHRRKGHLIAFPIHEKGDGGVGMLFSAHIIVGVVHVKLHAVFPLEQVPPFSV